MENSLRQEEEPGYKSPARAYDKELIEVLRTRTVVTEDQILSQLGVEPSVYDAVKAISYKMSNIRNRTLVYNTLEKKRDEKRVLQGA